MSAQVQPSLTLAEAQRMIRDAHRTNPDQFIWLYAIRQGYEGPVKIGVTRSPAARLKTLQQGNAERLVGIAAWRGFPAEEKDLHAQFDDARLCGEWFSPVPALLDLVQRLGGNFEDWA